jgi:hypothetical protein
MGEPTIEDRVLIRELYDRFYWALNQSDTDGMSELFAPGGYTVNYAGEKNLPEESAAIIESWRDVPVAQTRQHHVTGLIVDPDPDGDPSRRAVRLYFMVTELADPPANRIRWSCFARDVVQQVDGAWRIWRRKIDVNHMATA